MNMDKEPSPSSQDLGTSYKEEKEKKTEDKLESSTSSKKAQEQESSSNSSSSEASSSIDDMCPVAPESLIQISRFGKKDPKGCGMGCVRE
jgi:hypothetical protein